ncbi:hypothetical protein P9112_009704 [Eukaryota sp. TZLM1-RC]
MKLLVLVLLLTAVFARSVPYTIYHTTDVHGWLLPKRHNPTEDADFGDLQSMIEHTNSTALSKKENVLLFDSGDQVQGTGLSDATDVVGSVILETTAKLPYDGLTIGNHELGVPDTMDWIKKNYNHLHSGRMISANIYYQDEKLFAANHRIAKGPSSGHHILTFGFMYDDRYPHKNTRVETVQKTVQSPEFKAILHNNKNVAFIVVLCHFPHTNKETKTILNAIRNVHPKLGVVFLMGHRHLQQWNQLDRNAYAMESGCYYHSIGKLTFSLDEETGELQDVDHKWIKANREELIKEADVQEKHFDTKKGVAIRKFINKKFNDLKLGEVFGCAKRTYSRYEPISNPNSIFRLFINDVFPTVEVESSNQQIFVMNTGSIRTHMYEGEVTRDDVMAIDPFDNPYVVFYELSLKQLQDLLHSLHFFGDYGVSEDGSNRLPNYYHVWYEDGYPAYDVVTDEYTAVKLQQVLKVIDPSKDWDYEKYTSKFASSRSAFEHFIKNSPDFRCPMKLEDGKFYIPANQLPYILGAAVMVSAILSIGISLFIRRPKEMTLLDEDLEECLL